MSILDIQCNAVYQVMYTSVSQCREQQHKLFTPLKHRGTAQNGLSVTTTYHSLLLYSTLYVKYQSPEICTQSKRHDYMYVYISYIRRYQLIWNINISLKNAYPKSCFFLQMMQQLSLGSYMYLSSIIVQSPLFYPCMTSSLTVSS